MPLNISVVLHAVNNKKKEQEKLCCPQNAAKATGDFLRDFHLLPRLVAIENRLIL